MMKTALIADIGGTNARFGLVDEVNGLQFFESLECKDYASPTEAAEAYLRKIDAKIRPQSGVFAVAGPVTGDLINFTSSPWSFRTSSVQKDMGFDKFEVMNDFEAVARAIPDISPDLLHSFTNIDPKQGGNKVVIGPGTGLGVASLFWSGNRYLPSPGEGGHMTFSSRTQREFDIVQALHVKYHHISVERVCSGNGLVNVYNAIRALDKKYHLPDSTAAEISKRAISGECDVSKESLDLMLAFLGRTAGNLALALNAQGGVYIAGGIPTKLGDYFFKSKFMEEFKSKGRMSELMDKMPVYLIKHDAIGVLGLEQHAKLMLK